MLEQPNNNWRSRCRELGMDTQEVKAVSQRYDMYQSYTNAQGGETLDLERWYTWYRVEKLSEGHAMLTPPEQACSVGPDIESNSPVVSEADFLRLLLLYRQTKT